MPYVSVHVDVDEVIGEASVEELRQEIARRSAKAGSGYSVSDYIIPVKVAQTALDDAARLLRKMGRVDLAYKLDEIRVDYLNG